MTEIVDILFQDTTDSKNMDDNSQKIRVKFQNSIFQIGLSNLMAKMRENSDFQFTIPFKKQSYCQINLKYSIVHCAITVNFIILKPTGLPYRIASQFQKIHLIHSLFNKITSITCTVHPITGCLHFSTSFFCNNFNPIIMTQVINLIQQSLHQINILLPLIHKICQGSIDQLKEKDPKTNKLHCVKKMLAKSAFLIDDKVSNQTLADMLQKINKKSEKKSEIDEFNRIFSKDKNEKITLSNNDCSQLNYQIMRNATKLSGLALKNKSILTNYQKFQMDKSKEKEFINQLTLMKKEAMIKIDHLILGSIVVKASQSDMKTVFKIQKNLQKIKKGYKFQCLQTYLHSSYVNQHVRDHLFIFTIMQKKVRLSEFLSKNALSLSFSTKLKIFLDIFNSHNIIWKKNEIIFKGLSLSNIYISKKSVKFNNLHDAQYVEPEDLIFQAAVITWKRYQSCIQIALLFFQIIYGKNILFGNQDKNNTNYLQLQIQSEIFNRIRTDDIFQNAHLFGPKSIIVLLSSVFIRYFRKKINYQMPCNVPNTQLLSQLLLKSYEEMYAKLD